MSGRGHQSQYGWIPEEAIHEENWHERFAGMKSALQPFPGPRPIGTCKVPPDGRAWFHDYVPVLHGPLVDCRFDTAMILEAEEPQQ